MLFIEIEEKRTSLEVVEIYVFLFSNYCSYNYFMIRIPEFPLIKRSIDTCLHYYLRSRLCIMRKYQYSNCEFKLVFKFLFLYTYKQQAGTI